ncbi:MAG: MBL fold metallo-hydrolase, partial [Dehalococcoidia bacterium]|nr:MBL fold metallo-hydrolase [Dehalococcoidia bacterium]
PLLGPIDPVRGAVPTPVRSLVIRRGADVVLVDTGLGPRSRFPGAVCGMLLDQLALVGVHPGDVTHVVMSHAHGDHIGWNTFATESGRSLTFPNARYWITRREWEYWTQPERVERQPILEANLLPLLPSGQLALVDDDVDVIDGVRIAPTPGHTPGHCSVVVTGATDTAVYTGDISHHPLHYERPEWHAVFDVDPDHARATRRSFLRWAVEQGHLLVASHHPTPFGRATATATGFRWNPS